VTINQGAWSPTVFYADSSTPRQRMVNQDGWVVDDFPVPPGFQPSSGTDGEAIVIDRSTGRQYSGMGFRQVSPGQWTFYAMGVFNLNGSGWWDNNYEPWAGRASGGAMGGGLIRIEEARSGVIPHALACATYHHLNAPSSVSPAVTSDGRGPSSAMPMGSHIQLDPSLDLSTLNLEPGEHMLARALQVYGCYVVDSATGFVIYAENPTPHGANPYPSSWSNGLPSSLIGKMRIVAPPPRPAYERRANPPIRKCPRRAFNAKLRRCSSAPARPRSRG
jgi:hypothetical protein